MDTQLLKIIKELENKKFKKENLLKYRNNLENYSLILEKSLSQLEKDLWKEKIKLGTKSKGKYYLLKTLLILFFGIVLGLTLNLIIQGFMIANFVSLFSSFLFIFIFICDGLYYFILDDKIEKKYHNINNDNVYVNKIINNIEFKKNQQKEY